MKTANLIASRLAALAAFTALLGMAACSSTSGPELRASSPLIYVASQRTASYVSNCLEDKISSASESKVGNNVELSIGSNAWLVTLSPTTRGSTAKVQKSDRSDGGLPEPEMRFYIARYTV